MNEINEILNERAKTHGDFRKVGMCYHSLQKALNYGIGDKYEPQQKLALDMICQKLARIKEGDISCKDHWLDIAGYAMLVVKELEWREDIKKYENK